MEIAILGTKLALFSAINFLKDDFLFSSFYFLSVGELSNGLISMESVAMD